MVCVPDIEKHSTPLNPVLRVALEFILCSNWVAGLFLRAAHSHTLDILLSVFAYVLALAL